MCLLFETICIQDGIPVNMEYHCRRMNFTRSSLFGIHEPLQLPGFNVLPDAMKRGIIKHKIFYKEEFIRAEYEIYHPRLVHSLKMIEADELDYSHKYADRNSLDCLFQQRGENDDVLIIKKGMVTDTSIANILFFDGSSWFTPDKPLLKGTQRQFILDRGMAKAVPIQSADIRNYSLAMVVNSMKPFNPAESFSTENIEML